MLYEMQRERVKMDFEIEKKLQKTFPSLSNDVRILRDLLNDLESAQKAYDDKDIQDDLI